MNKSKTKIIFLGGFGGMPMGNGGGMGSMLHSARSFAMNLQPFLSKFSLNSRDRLKRQAEEFETEMLQPSSNGIGTERTPTDSAIDRIKKMIDKVMETTKQMIEKVKKAMSNNGNGSNASPETT